MGCVFVCDEGVVERGKVTLTKGSFQIQKGQVRGESKEAKQEFQRETYLKSQSMIVSHALFITSCFFSASLHP